MTKAKDKQLEEMEHQLRFVMEQQLRSIDDAIDRYSENRGAKIIHSFQDLQVVITHNSHPSGTFGVWSAEQEQSLVQ
jgi:hypothetical protein